jgi:hypothetical protein
VFVVQAQPPQQQQPPPIPKQQPPIPPPATQGQPPIYQQQQPPVTGQPSHMPQAHRAKSVLGSRVSIQGNLNIGTLDDIIFDDNGYIDYLIVQNQGKFVTVPWEAAKFNFEQHTMSVDVNQQQFQQVPTYTTQWPTFYEPAYRTQIYRFYGLTPGQERRMERRPVRGGGG